MSYLEFDITLEDKKRAFDFGCKLCPGDIITGNQFNRIHNLLVLKIKIREVSYLDEEPFYEYPEITALNLSSGVKSTFTDILFRYGEWKVLARLP